MHLAYGYCFFFSWRHVLHYWFSSPIYGSDPDLVESILLQIEAESKATWKKLLVFLKENVAIPFPVPKDDEAVPNVRREATAEADTPINDEL